MQKTVTRIDGDVRRVWEELSKDSLRSLREISEVLHIPYSRVRRITDRLVSEKIIRGYKAIFNPLKLGLRHSALAFFRTNPSEPHMRRKLFDIPNVEKVFVLSGTYSLMALLKCSSRDSYEETLAKLDKLIAKSKFKQSDYVSIIKTYKEDGVPLPYENNEGNNNGNPIKLDQKDLLILRTIYYQKTDKNHILPMPSTELSKKLGISQPSVHRRLKRLINEGVILSIRADPSFYEYNKDLFLIAIKADLRNSRHILEFLIKNERIKSLYRVGREYQFRAIVSTDSIKDLQKFLDRLYEISGVIDTNTQIIFSEKHSGIINF